VAVTIVLLVAGGFAYWRHEEHMETLARGAELLKSHMPSGAARGPPFMPGCLLAVAGLDATARAPFAWEPAQQILGAAASWRMRLLHVAVRVLLDRTLCPPAQFLPRAH